MRVPRKDIKNWWKNKQAEALAIEKDLVFYAYTDGGEVKQGGTFKIDGMEYYQPECHCDSSGHICYMRPMPQVVDIDINKIKTDSGKVVKNKTDGGKVFYGETLGEEIVKEMDTSEYRRGVADAKDLMYHVYGLEPDSSTWNGLGKRGK